MRKMIGKPQMLKELNSSLIEQMIDERGPLTKPKLAKMTSLSLPTVNKLVEDLEAGGHICQVGLSGKGAGRKAALYQTNKDFGCFAVLYYQWGKFVCRIADVTGATLCETTLPLDDSTLDTAIQSILSATDELLARAPTQVKCIGIGVPGAVQPDGRLLGIPKIQVWEGYNLGELLSKHYQMDVCVENDVKLSAVGYYHTNLKDKWENIVYLYAGNGMGAGIIIDRKLHRGFSNFSGELGFMAPLDGQVPNKDFTSQGGYLETQFRRFVNASQGECWQKDDPEQRRALTHLLGAAAVNHISVINPDAIVFGGEAFDETLTEAIREQIAFYIPQQSMPHILYDRKDSTGIDGLILTCRGYVTTRMQLIRSAGI